MIEFKKKFNLLFINIQNININVQTLKDPFLFNQIGVKMDILVYYDLFKNKNVLEKEKDQSSI